MPKEGGVIITRLCYNHMEAGNTSSGKLAAGEVLVRIDGEVGEAMTLICPAFFSRSSSSNQVVRVFDPFLCLPIIWILLLTAQ